MGNAKPARATWGPGKPARATRGHWKTSLSDLSILESKPKRPAGRGNTAVRTYAFPEVCMYVRIFVGFNFSSGWQPGNCRCDLCQHRSLLLAYVRLVTVHVKGPQSLKLLRIHVTHFTPADLWVVESTPERPVGPGKPTRATCGSWKASQRDLWAMEDQPERPVGPGKPATASCGSWKASHRDLWVLES